MRLLVFMLLLTACASKTPAPDVASALTSDLKVSSTTSGHLRARLTLTNPTKNALTIPGPGASAFRVETIDGKAMAFKGSRTPPAPLVLKPGESVETAFSLQDNYAFWDRRTKYKIWFESPELKSNVVQVWF